MLAQRRLGAVEDLNGPSFGENERVRARVDSLDFRANIQVVEFLIKSNIRRQFMNRRCRLASFKMDWVSHSRELG